MGRVPPPTAKSSAKPKAKKLNPTSSKNQQKQQRRLPKESKRGDADGATRKQLPPKTHGKRPLYQVFDLTQEEDNTSPSTHKRGRNGINTDNALRLSFRDAWQSGAKRNRALWFSLKPRASQSCWSIFSSNFRKVHAQQRFGLLLQAQHPRDPATTQEDDDLLLVKADNKPFGKPAPSTTWRKLLQATGVDSCDGLVYDLLLLVRRELLVIFWDPIESAGLELVLTIALDWQLYRSLVGFDDLESSLALPTRGKKLSKSMHRVMLWLLNGTFQCNGTATMSSIATQQVMDLTDEESDPMDSTGDFGLQCDWKYPYLEEIPVLFDRYVNHRNANPSAGSSEDFDFTRVYGYLEERHKCQLQVAPSAIRNNFLNDPSDKLLVSLRRYQQQAVEWMISREQASGPLFERAGHQASPGPCSTLVTMVCRRTGAVVAFYDLFTTRFYDSKVDETPLVFQPFSIQGGILADEMGLGKTVEVIALVATHVAPARFLRVPLRTMPLDPVAKRENNAKSRECICGSEEDHVDGWVQCAGCLSWHHQECVGWSQAQKHRFKCFQCYYDLQYARASIPCKTTLIVSPESIHSQWEEELRRHVRPGGLRVWRYQGVHTTRLDLERKRKPCREWQIIANPCTWTQADVVLTTYEALTKDLVFVPDEALIARRRSTRQKKKRYAFIMSPLVVMRFWRVCMDEAQVGVENAQLRASLMANHLACEHRWIVTGTPFSHHWKDLHGALKFLQVVPFGDEKWFDQLVEASHRAAAADTLGVVNGAEAYQRVLDLLVQVTENSDNNTSQPYQHQLIWRTQKKHVMDQLQLPSQTQETIFCEFSPVEQHFYAQQQLKVKRMLEQVQRTSQPKNLNNDFYQNPNAKDQVDGELWRHLLLLRQICGHPQLGNHGNHRPTHHTPARSMTSPLRFHPPKASFLTMDAFLMELVTKNQLKCQEAQRHVVAAQNAICGLLVLQQQVEPAIRNYLATIDMIRSNWPRFRADLLPRLHILKNLSRVVRQHFQLPTAAWSPSTSHHHTLLPSDLDVNPQQASMLPCLDVLTKQMDRTCCDETTLTAIQEECDAMEHNGCLIKRFYLSQIDVSHATALKLFETQWEANNHLMEALSESSSSAKPSQNEELESQRMLLLSHQGGKWWLDALAAIHQLSNDGGALFLDTLRARLQTCGSKWTKAFSQQFATLKSFRDCFSQELESLATKRSEIFDKLMELGHEEPTKQAIQRSGNCAKCRAGCHGPICDHCQLHQRMQNYRLHLLGLDATFGRVASKKNKCRHPQDFHEVDDPDHTAWIPSSSESTWSTSNNVASGSLVVEVFKVIAHFAKELLHRSNKKANHHHHHNTKKPMGDLEAYLHRENDFYSALMKEWAAAKRLLQAQHQRLGELDELEMAMMPMRLRMDQLDDDPANQAIATQCTVESHELDAKLEAFQLEKDVAEQELQQNHSQLRYLLHLMKPRTKFTAPSSWTHLRETQDKARLMPEEENDGECTGELELEEDECCLICLEPMTGERAVLGTCAHAFCRACMETLTQSQLSSSPQGPSGVSPFDMFKSSINCPSCRRLCAVEDIQFVRAQRPVHGDSSLAPAKANHETTQLVTIDDDVELKVAGHSAKIDAVVRRMLKLAQQKPQVKVIAFSQWQDMLHLLSWALTRNGISCFGYTTKRKLGQLIQEFKLCMTPCVLLLPYSVGANGLNLVEASEVFLIEPLLNSSLESQAINRVHRIGQSQPTKVHRFVVLHSVEEKMAQRNRNLLLQALPTKPRGEESAKDQEDGAGLAMEPSDLEDIELLDVDDQVLAVVSHGEREDLTLQQLGALLDESTEPTC